MTSSGGGPGAPAVEAVQAYLHEHIPLSRGMGVEVVSVDAAGVRLAAPLGPNINHRSTVFGGSLSALGILAGWTLVHTRLAPRHAPVGVVIQHNSVKYLQPATGRFEAFCPLPAAEAWRRFEEMLARKGRARIDVRVELSDAGGPVGLLEGRYVAILAADDGA